MEKKQEKKNIVIYRAKNGAIELRGDISHETIWATQAQIVELFEVDQSVVSRHIRNIFKDGEIKQKSNMQKMHIANSDKPVTYYSLDMILGVGYRTNSKIAIEFRKWATKTLREHITKGYTINRKQIAKNYDVFMKSVTDIQALLPEHVNLDPKSILERQIISIGTLNSSLVHPREVFEPAVKLSAASVIVAHNHPSGELDPSPEDREVTKRLVEAGKLLGISLIDHVILSKNGHLSFQQSNIL